MTELTFDFTWTYSEQADGITIPSILLYGGKIAYTYAKVDTGAEFCIFSNEVGMQLGLDIERGLPKRMGSLTGSLETFGHEVTLQTFGIAFQSTIYFARYPGLERNLLGRNGWLRHLQLAIIDYENTLHLSQYS
jgi:hypothetical protein